MTSTATKLETVASFARRHGITRQAAHDLVRRGKLTTIGGRLHPDIADAEYARVRPRANAAAPAAAAPPARAAAGLVFDDGTPAYAVSRARREHMAALREEVEHRRVIGELLDAADVRAAVDDAAAEVRGALEGLADRLAPQLAGFGADERRAHALLTAAAADVLGGLVQRFEQLAAAAPADAQPGAAAE